MYFLKMNQKKISLQEVKENWQRIKRQEKKEDQDKENDSDYFAKIKKEKYFPATIQALKIGEKANKINFDWQKPIDVLKVLKSEMIELEQEFINPENIELSKVKAEMGDMYFCLAQLCRHLQINPELVAQEGNNKFLRRFSQLEKIAKMKSINISQSSQETLESIWQEAKETLKKES